MTTRTSVPQVRTDLDITRTPHAVEVADPVGGQRWVLSTDEAAVWQFLSSDMRQGQPADVAWVNLCTRANPGLTAARVWVALDALADRGLLGHHVAPPAAEVVSRHQGLPRRQWALAGLAMAAAPAAFAATAMGAEESAKGLRAKSEEKQKALSHDGMAASAPDDATIPAADARAKEQQVKRDAKRASQEEDVKARHQEQDRKKQDTSSRQQEQQEKRADRRSEETAKQSSRQAEQQQKRAKASGSAEQEAK